MFTLYLKLMKMNPQKIQILTFASKLQERTPYPNWSGMCKSSVALKTIITETPCDPLAKS